MVAAWAAERTRAEAIAVLLEAGLAASPVNTYNDAAKDPHIIERDVLQPGQDRRRLNCDSYQTRREVLPHANTRAKRRSFDRAAQ
jgi:crotonobetainyl-CoA:carnitine CoA-transferase CaiB-like acyl-CoA transferase